MPTMKCPVCRRLFLLTVIKDHLTDQHSKDVLAEVLLEVTMPCGKKRYPSQEDAANALVRMSIKADPMRKETRVYKCPQCRNSWHLTSQD